MSFLKSVKFRHVKMSIQSVVWLLVAFNLGFCFDFAVKLIQPVVSKIELVVFFENLNKILLSWLNWFLMILTAFGSWINCFDHLIGVYKGFFTLLCKN